MRLDAEYFQANSGRAWNTFKGSFEDLLSLESLCKGVVKNQSSGDIVKFNQKQYEFVTLF